MIHAAAPDGSRDKFVDFGNVSRVARVLDAETIRLHPQDGASMKLWVERLKEENILIFYKDKLDASPPGLPMHENDLLLCIQTPYQLDAFRRLGHRFIGIDATHNTTQYKDIMLYTMIARDDWGHGASAVPGSCPWILTTSTVRCTSCLDAHIIYENGRGQILSKLGAGRQSGYSAIDFYVRS